MGWKNISLIYKRKNKLKFEKSPTFPNAKFLKNKLNHSI